MRRAAAIVCLALVAALAQPAASAELSVGAGTTLDLGTATLDLGCADANVAGVVAGGFGTLAQARDFAIDPSGVVFGESGTIEVTGHWNNAGSFSAQSSSVAFVDGCGVSQADILGSSVFSNLSIVSATGKQFHFEALSTQTITGSLTLTGDTGVPLVIRSTQGGIAGLLDVSGTQSIASVDVEDSYAIGTKLIADPGSLLGINTSGWAFPAHLPALAPGSLLGLMLLLAAFGLRRLQRV